MKYSKEFQQILDASDFPDDWKTSAIEYRKLKKLIKNVVAELEAMGLPPSVLHQLLVTEGVAGSNGSTSNNSNAVTAVGGGTPMSEAEEGVFEFEFEVDHDGPAVAPSVSPKEVIVDPVFEEDDTPGLEPGSLPKELTHRFRLRMLSDAQANSFSPLPLANGSVPGTPLVDDTGSPRPIGVAEMLRTRSGGYDVPSSSSRSRSASPAPSGTIESRRIVHRAGTDQGSVTVEYVLAGDEANPVPQIRLNVSNFETFARRPFSSRADSTPTDTTANTPTSYQNELPTDTDDEDDSIYEDSSRGRSRNESLDDHSLPAVPPSPSLLRLRTAASPIWAMASSGNADGLADLSIGEAVNPDDASEIMDLTTPTMNPSPAPMAPSMALTATRLNEQQAMEAIAPVTSQDRQFIIPLQSDLAFFNVLTAALKSLSEFHAAQQAAFHADVNALCQSISQSIQPGDRPMVLPTPINSGSGGQLVKFEYSPGINPVSQKDLYAWREIFSLWVESEIFESSSEMDRGERTVIEAERRLKVFANEVVKRGLGDRRSFKGKRTRKAWNEFLRLNVLLLDLKRFQMANINAARKILKKHDKRTALTASTGLASFVRTTLTAHVDKDGNVSTWTFYNTSLPHVLLACLTDTLLPILPSLDDYACLICMSIAFKPIRLSCGHLFCVRCLVKMQQRRKEMCPLCRAPSVLLADKSCLDTSLMSFMRDWFPKEVREKSRENTTEIAKEQLEDAGIDTKCCIM